MFCCAQLLLVKLNQVSVYLFLIENKNERNLNQFYRFKIYTLGNDGRQSYQAPF
jgi:hypothetical protein